MFWNAFKITLGICAAIVGGYLVVLLVAVLWLDGWFARNVWVFGVAVSAVGLAVWQALVEAWQGRKKLPEPEPAAQPEPDRRAAKAATN